MKTFKDYILEKETIQEPLLEGLFDGINDITKIMKAVKDVKKTIESEMKKAEKLKQDEKVKLVIELLPKVIKQLRADINKTSFDDKTKEDFVQDFKNGMIKNFEKKMKGMLSNDEFKKLMNFIEEA